MPNLPFSARNICKDHVDEWNRLGRHLEKAFTEANPGIVPVKPSTLNNSEFRRFREPLPWLDHTGRIRDRAGGEIVYISQPYTPPAVGTILLPRYKSQTPKELTIVNAGQMRSWYYLGASHLVVLGPPEAIESICLDYPTDDAPWDFQCDRHNPIELAQSP